MAQKGKWVDAEPQERVTKVARRALGGRLKLVARQLPRAAASDISNAEPVHQLRVATRRAWAALECYRELLPKRGGEWLRKQLKRIRKAAGDARDLDVLRQRLAGEPEHSGHQWEPLLARIDQLREQARRPIADLCDRLEAKGFRRRSRKLVKAIGWRRGCHGSDEPGFVRAARERMREVADAFFIAASGDLSDIAVLHEFRILGKQLRYAMELTHAAFASCFRDQLYPQIEQVQEKIGMTIDHATAIERFERWLAEFDEPGLKGLVERLLADERRALAASRSEFGQWWTEDRAKQLQRQFDDVLTRPMVERVA